MAKRPSVVTASEIPAPDKSYMLPWSLEMMYEIEPRLKKIADRALEVKGSQKDDVLINAYTKARSECYELVGWAARDPRLRSTEAYDFYTDYIIAELDI